MGKAEESDEEATYPVRVAARMTGLTPELIRAWEARYGAVRPRRTEGGSRRYSGGDLRRLQLLRGVVEAGHRIGRIAELSTEELEGLLPSESKTADASIDHLITVAERLDAGELSQLLSQRAAEQGVVAFAIQMGLPLLAEMGHRWKEGKLNISVEHLATSVVRSLLVSEIQSAPTPIGAPRLVFATPSDEPHDLGTLVAAVVAAKAGAEVIFVGADVPVDDLVASVLDARATVLVLGLVTLPREKSEQALRGLRSGLPAHVRVWVGGAGIAGLSPIKGVERIGNLDQLEAHVTLLLGGNLDATAVLDSGAQGGA